MASTLVPPKVLDINWTSVAHKMSVLVTRVVSPATLLLPTAIHGVAKFFSLVMKRHPLVVRIANNINLAKRAPHVSLVMFLIREFPFGSKAWSITSVLHKIFHVCAPLASHGKA